MTKFITIACASLVLLLLGVVSADAGGSWSGYWTGPYGGQRSATAGCGYHGCGYSVQGVGPQGQTWSRSGAVVQGPFRSYGYRAFTGPEGNTFVTRRAWRRY